MTKQTIETHLRAAIQAARTTPPKQSHLDALGTWTEAAEAERDASRLADLLGDAEHEVVLEVRSALRAFEGAPSSSAAVQEMRRWAAVARAELLLRYDAPEARIHSLETEAERLRDGLDMLNQRLDRQARMVETAPLRPEVESGASETRAFEAAAHEIGAKRTRAKSSKKSTRA